MSFEVRNYRKTLEQNNAIEEMPQETSEAKIVENIKKEWVLLDCCRRKPINPARVKLEILEPTSVDSLNAIGSLTSPDILKAMESVAPTTPYIGLNASEPRINWGRWFKIKQQNALSYFYSSQGVSQAKAFAAEFAQESSASLYGGDSAVTLDAHLSEIFRLPKLEGVKTSYALVSGDSVKNLKDLKDLKQKFPANDVGIVICANDTRHFGVADIAPGTQEESVTRQSNFFALSDEMDRLRNGKARFIPTLGVTYIKHAAFMDKEIGELAKDWGAADHFFADAAFVAALDLREGSDDLVNITEAARKAGLETHELIKFVTKMKFAALFGSFIQNDVTDVLMSLPGLSAFNNDLEIIEEILHELLFREDAPFSNRFNSITFNVFGDSKTASSMDQKIAAMLGKVKGINNEPLVNRAPFLGDDVSVTKALKTTSEIVVSYALRDIIQYADRARYFTFSHSGLTSFLGNLHPCKISIFGHVFNCAEAAYQWRKFSMVANHHARNSADDHIKAKAHSLLDDPRLHELITATGGRALDITKQLEREYPDMLSGWEIYSNGELANILLSKFEQNEPLRELLLATDNAYLVEYSKTGINMLGRLLMWVRDGLPNGVYGEQPKEYISNQEKELIQRHINAYDEAYGSNTPIYDIFDQREQ